MDGFDSGPRFSLVIGFLRAEVLLPRIMYLAVRVFQIALRPASVVLVARSQA